MTLWNRKSVAMVGEKPHLLVGLAVVQRNGSQVVESLREVCADVF